MVHYAWRLEAAVWRRKESRETQEDESIRYKPRLFLVFDLSWEWPLYTVQNHIYGYIDHTGGKPDRWLVHYFPMDSRGLDVTYYSQVGRRCQHLHEGEKCEPRDTPKDAAKRLLDLAMEDSRILQPDHEALLIVGSDFVDLLLKLNTRYLRKYPKRDYAG
jgi:hypothetical protein